MENHHAINGKTHYFYGHFQVRKLLVYQRLYPIIIPWNSPLLTIKSPFSYGKPGLGKPEGSYGIFRLSSLFSHLDR